MLLCLQLDSGESRSLSLNGMTVEQIIVTNRNESMAEVDVETNGQTIPLLTGTGTSAYRVGEKIEELTVSVNCPGAKYPISVALALKPRLPLPLLIAGGIILLLLLRW